ncbi:hypothetical protein [Arthrobacter antibioticus]|uniref:hypothetical protein n=1 Tax=Arthrobacter sp. H35-MC1 TaxID=3046203 RepID=UPI0024BB2BA0|nr:hypothetical protein [Arthrobacter sp. H35-MC1]MDJ0316664.1 hypothetical protein [Arthrobacter sp. H35-MC1]
MSSQFQLKGHSMESLRWQLFETYGSRARIIRAERIQTGGVFGIGAITSFEVNVEVDDLQEDDPGLTRHERSRLVEVNRGPAVPRRGLGALLAQADNADSAAPSQTLKALEQKPDFDAIMGELAGEDPYDDSAQVDSARAMPRPSQRPGDVIILAGLREQPLHTAWSMISTLMGGADLLTAGDHRSVGVSHVFLDSVGVKRAQALAASVGRPLLIAFSFGQRGSSNLSVLASLRPAQLWLVVDAAHKPEDTQSWVRRACRYAVPDALAVVGATDTMTPETVNELRLPVGWVDGHQATSTEL